ncbi:hypothetical protein NKR23_g3361 [Pleurostoma richardsiae]|uniref:Uncharacterized protein n=1 Tax=Pleurostoma richardsiae TaxID=41990 RepID=A0AA38VWN0_9PEZI|nr:hypothetical protein NKR23_g3361 [Pleurostoma richardsiae]
MTTLTETVVDRTDVPFVKAKINYYQDPSENPDLNGLSTHEIRIQRRREDAPDVCPLEVDIKNLRGHEADFTLSENGFQVCLLDSALTVWDDEAALKRVYFPEITELLKRTLGAKHVIQYEHHVRRKTLAEALAQNSNDAVDISGPVRRLHIDETPVSARREFAYYVKDPELRSRPFGIYNVWKPLRTVRRDPLCLVDARTLAPGDFRVGRVTVPNVGEIENYSIRAPAESDRDRHRFYFVGGQTEKEALVFRIFDERHMAVEDKATKFGVAHTSFEDPATIDLPEARESIEVRSFCIF